MCECGSEWLSVYTVCDRVMVWQLVQCGIGSSVMIG